jgi:hypothetical protein
MTFLNHNPFTPAHDAMENFEDGFRQINESRFRVTFTNKFQEDGHLFGPDSLDSDGPKDQYDWTQSCLRQLHLNGSNQTHGNYF